MLAGIYSIESNFGRLQAPGVRSGENFAGAGGPGQFLAGTWALYAVDGDGDGAKDRYNPADAIPSSANLLRQSGAPGDYRRAIFAYNHANWYVHDVLGRAARYCAAATRDPDALQAPLPPDASESAACTQLAASGGPTDFDTALRLSSPTAYRPLPAWAMASGRPPQPVDARIYGDAVWLLRRYASPQPASRATTHTGTAPPSTSYRQPAPRSRTGTGAPAGWRESSAGRRAAGARARGPAARSSRQSNSSATTASRAMARREPARRLPGPPPRLLGLGLLRVGRARRAEPVGDGVPRTGRRGGGRRAASRRGGQRRRSGWDAAVVSRRCGNLDRTRSCRPCRRQPRAPS